MDDLPIAKELRIRDCGYNELGLRDKIADDPSIWVERFLGTLECANWYKSLLSDYYGEIPVKYLEWYISLRAEGEAISTIFFHQRLRLLRRYAPRNDR